jgi:AraC-like DNA-binding protein
MHEDICYVTADACLPFTVEMAGISYCDGAYRIARQQASIAVVEYVISGSGTVQEDQAQFNPAAGDVYLLHPNRSHRYAADPADPWTKIWFNIRGPVVDQLLQAYQLNEVSWIRDCPQAVLDLFRSFLDMAQTDLPLAEKSGRCALIFHEIVLALHAHIQNTGSLPTETSLLLRFIESHLFDPVSLDDMARSIYRSRAYTVRLLKRSCGQTPYAFLAARRIEAARQLLAGTRLPVKNIAEQLCYADQHYFATVFRRAVGLSPRQYRRLHQSGADDEAAGTV